MRAMPHVWRLRHDRKIGQHIRGTLKQLVLWSLDVEAKDQRANASHQEK